MDLVKAVNVLTSVALGLGVAHCGSPQSAPISRPPVEGGVPGGLAVPEVDLVERIFLARCDVSESCNRVGPGATYRNRDDCMSRTRAQLSGQLGTSRCRGAVGETRVSQCVKSLQMSECDEPGQLHAEHPRHTTLGAQCNPDLMCLE
jgi:hypothetical protein